MRPPMMSFANSNITAADIRSALGKHSDTRQATILQRFFKTGPGQYGEGDIFIGVKVPQTRAVAKQFHSAPIDEILSLLKSAVHEERLLALLLMVEEYSRGNDSIRKKINNSYLANTRYINNWDLVDLSAPQIVGGYLIDRDRSILRKLALSRSLWERRISIIATFHFIKNGDLSDTFEIAGILIDDTHDLIHKAVGWMLRETGKRDIKAEEEFLIPNYKRMPRTMLRYAIERFPEKKRQAYLKGTV
jgi:3-methyladenine DNA glycosylase AlkD